MFILLKKDKYNKLMHAESSDNSVEFRRAVYSA